MMNEKVLILRCCPVCGTCVLTQDGRTACEMICTRAPGNDKNKLTVKLWYDFRDAPLVLTADAAAGDEAVVKIRPYRIELFMQDTLCDEEWPCGSGFLTAESRAEGDFLPELFLSPEEKNACCRPLRRGIPLAALRAPGVNIGDCIPFSDETDSDGLYHLFYLYDRHHHKSKWGLGAHQWAHASTADFKSWNEHPMAIGITEPWEGSICTGSVCRADDADGSPAWYAWYAVRMSDRSPARVTYAKSKDLAHFEKCGSYFHLPAGYEPTSARDPKVFYQDGVFHMFVTTTRQSTGNGCLAHLVNEKMTVDGWRDAGVTVEWTKTFPDEPEKRHQPECPDHFKMGDTYYIVFGIRGTAHYGFSDNPYGGWIFPENDTIPCGAVPKSAVLPGTQRRIFSGFICEDDGYAGHLCAVEALQNPDKTLRFSLLSL